MLEHICETLYGVIILPDLCFHLTQMSHKQTFAVCLSTTAGESWESFPPRASILGCSPRVFWGAPLRHSESDPQRCWAGFCLRPLLGSSLRPEEGPGSGESWVPSDQVMSLAGCLRPRAVCSVLRPPAQPRESVLGRLSSPAQASHPGRALALSSGLSRFPFGPVSEQQQQQQHSCCAGLPAPFLGM